MDERVAQLGGAAKGAKDVGGEGKVVFSQTGNGHRVRCDVPVPNRRVGLALIRIIEAFRASVVRVEGKGGLVKEKRQGS